MTAAEEDSARHEQRLDWRFLTLSQRCNRSETSVQVIHYVFAFPADGIVPRFSDFDPVHLLIGVSFRGSLLLHLQHGPVKCRIKMNAEIGESQTANSIDCGIITKVSFGLRPKSACTPKRVASTLRRTKFVLGMGSDRLWMLVASASGSNCRSPSSETYEFRKSA